MFERTRTGLREMPSNAAWLLSRALQPAEDAAAGARDQGRKVTAAVVDAAPVGDSVEIRARRARRRACPGGRGASSRGRAGVQGARRSRARGERARSGSHQGRGARDEPGGQTACRRGGKDRRRVRQAGAPEAEADAEDQRQEVEEEVDDEIAEAEAEAEASQQRAEELVEDAAEALAEPRRLADEAAEAARSAAQEANRQAQQLQDEAKQRASDAEARVKAADLRQRAAATAKDTARELDRETTNGGLDAHKKPELVELAATIGIENRSNMTKGELVDAITRPLVGG